MVSPRRRAKAEQFRKRRNNFFSRGNEMCAVCGVDMFVVIRDESGRFWTYQNRQGPAWPPSADYIVRKHIELLLALS
jgi:hypothetical protein